MARTKQTARKPTGGNAPRKKLATVAPDRQSSESSGITFATAPSPISALDIVIKNGFLRWYQLQSLSETSKELRAIVDETIDKDSLPDWPLVVAYLNERNTFHRCAECYSDNVGGECSCWDGYSSETEDDEEYRELSTYPINHDDPRNSNDEPFRSLSPRLQAVRLFNFHRCCINNYWESMPKECLTQYKYFCCTFGSGRSLNEAFNALEKYNPAAHRLLHNVAEIVAAEKALSDDIVCSDAHRACFDKECFGYDESQFYWVEFLTEVVSIVRMHEADEHDPPLSNKPLRYDFEEVTASQMQHVGNSIRRVLLKSCATAGMLFGPEMADSINVMRKARTDIIPKMAKIFPLKWMPLVPFGDDPDGYEPPETDAYHPDRLTIVPITRKHKRELEEGLDEVKRYKTAMGSVAEEYVCFITSELPVDPVMAEDGRVYERSAIEQRIERQGRNFKSPTTNEPIGPRLLPAIQVRNSIRKLMESGAIGGALAETWEQRVKVNETKSKAEEGDIEAICQLGHWYSKGENGLPIDDEVAYCWYRKAVDLQSVEATFFAGFMLIFGRGVGKSVAEGMALVGEAAGRGLDVAAFHLATWYRKGKNSLPRDEARAIYWLRKVTDGSCCHKVLSDNDINEAKRMLKGLVEED